ncbi:hypothetical protein J6590_059082 [Homalodisca vitripennis]|nr:hypothetical protein J6590_059082 [Homalodisca vitripennis]
MKDMLASYSAELLSPRQHIQGAVLDVMNVTSAARVSSLEALLTSAHVLVAATALVNYYTFRENNPEFYDVNPLDLSFIGDADAVSVMPYREQTGRRILIYKLGKWNPSQYAADELFKATLAILELGILEPRAQVLGGRVIWDLEGLTMAHYWQISPAIVQKVIEIMVTSFPMKVHSIHIVNESWVFDMIFSMFKPFLGRRYRDILTGYQLARIVRDTKFFEFINKFLNDSSLMTLIQSSFL